MSCGKSVAGVPTDYELWTDLCVEYLKLVRKHDPEFRWAQIWNEPNSWWFREDQKFKDDLMEPSRGYAEMFRIAATKIKRAIPDMWVGGPTLCWPPTYGSSHVGWYTWRSRIG